MTSTPHRRSRSCHTLSLSPLSQLPRNYLCSGAQGPSAILHPPVGAGASSTEQLTEHVQTPWRAVQPAQRVLAAPAASSELHLHGALVLDLPWKGIFWLWVEADPHTTFNTLRLTPFRCILSLAKIQVCFPMWKPQPHTQTAPQIREGGTEHAISLTSVKTLTLSVQVLGNSFNFKLYEL